MTARRGRWNVAQDSQKALTPRLHLAVTILQRVRIFPIGHDGILE